MPVGVGISECSSFIHLTSLRLGLSRLLFVTLFKRFSGDNYLRSHLHNKGFHRVRGADVIFQAINQLIIQVKYCAIQSKTNLWFSSFGKEQQ